MSQAGVWYSQLERGFCFEIFVSRKMQISHSTPRYFVVIRLTSTPPTPPPHHPGASPLLTSNSTSRLNLASPLYNLNPTSIYVTPTHLTRQPQLNIHPTPPNECDFATYIGPRNILHWFAVRNSASPSTKMPAAVICRCLLSWNQSSVPPSHTLYIIINASILRLHVMLHIT